MGSKRRALAGWMFALGAGAPLRLRGTEVCVDRHQKKKSNSVVFGYLAKEDRCRAAKISDRTAKRIQLEKECEIEEIKV